MIRTGRPARSTSDTLFRVCLIWFIMKRRRVDGLGAGAFLSRAKTLPLLTIDNARSDPKTHGGRHTRARTALYFQNSTTALARAGDPEF